MGLEEKRAVQNFEKEELANGLAKIKQITGKDIPVEIDWNSFGYLTEIEGLKRNFFSNFTEALNSICRDNLGKEAIQSSLKKITVKNSGQGADAKIDLSNGTLGIVWGWTGAYPTVTDYTNYIESKL